MNRISLLIVMVLTWGAQVGFAATGNSWNGTWKLNDAKSQRTGVVDTITKDTDGKYTVKTSGLSLSFACDGADYPMPGGRTMSCTKVSDTDLHTVFKTNGEELGQIERTLSDNGQTMTSVQTGKAADGTPYHSTNISKKISQGSGDAWTGAWQDTKVQTTTRNVAVIEAQPEAMKFTYPTAKSSLVIKLDGTPASEQGPHPEKGLLISMTSAGPNTIHEVDTLDGTVIEHDTLTLTPDGKTLTIESERTGNKVKQIYVYEKQ